MAALLLGLIFEQANAAGLENDFENPPDAARPGVYWYFMDGNLSREEMAADLLSMKNAGIGNLVFLEVNVGVPRGPVDFMSEEWQEMFAFAVHEAERLGIEITLGSGPGWSGSGGPWVETEQSMQHLVATAMEVKGPTVLHQAVPVPAPRPPTRYSKLTPELESRREAFYRDVAVLAFPTPAGNRRVSDIDEKALFDRLPFSSVQGVKPFLPAPAEFPIVPTGEVIEREKILDLAGCLLPDGTLNWEVPPGSWTILRFCSRNNGSNTRPAPHPGYGFECDKFDAAAFDRHFDSYVGRLLKKVGPRRKGAGWTMLHIDSWEMGAQNWTPRFREEFRERRGYDPLPFYPAYTGRIVDSLEITERFLWDLRLTAQELVLKNHALRLKELGRRHGFGLSIEPYDMNPCADLDLGAVADLPMCEFWSDGYGFDTSYSCIEAASIAHTMGRPVVAAEAFTALPQEAWQQYPASMKNQSDWALCMGINRFVFHTFAHKPLGEEHRPGMTMGPYGVHWDRGQTWWPMVNAYHRYLTRCSHLLRQGRAVSDILYLTPEGAPHVFRPPPDALEGEGMMADKRGHRFDGCSPGILIERAEVKDGRIVFPGGTSYALLVLPGFDTMTPGLLQKIAALVDAGAAAIGSPPVKSPGLSGYPSCDSEVRALADKVWGSRHAPAGNTERRFGKGRIFRGGDLSIADGSLYPSYHTTSSLLKKIVLPVDFAASGPVRFTHRRTEEREIYFLASKSNRPMQADCTFRVAMGEPELWDPVTGARRALPQYGREGGLTTIPLQFEPHESFFVIFPRKASSTLKDSPARAVNFPKIESLAVLEGAWEVSFDPGRGGPEKITFDTLEDWTGREERGIRFYSGIATYRKTFDLPDRWEKGSSLFLDLGAVRDIARLRLNGEDLGIVWTAPWRKEITDVMRQAGNILEIEVANRWQNRLVGDQSAPDAAVRTLSWPSGFLGGRKFETGRYTFTTRHPFNKDSALLPSGLLGPVTIRTRSGGR